ncbi:MAG: hypothetical protein AAGJ85_01910, partial [Pseudomonadota bacterium]
MRFTDFNDSKTLLTDGPAAFWVKGLSPIDNDFKLSSLQPGAEDDDSTIALGTDLIAFAIVNSADTNVTSFTVDPDNSARNGAFTSGNNDVFGITDRTINDNYADDGGADVFGIVSVGDTAKFFAVQDTANAVNPDLDGTATWVFDISAATELGNLTIDMAALGDFDPLDTYQFSASIDNGAAFILFDIRSDEDGSLTYTFDGGGSITEDDPLVVDVDGIDTNLVLNNNFATFTSSRLDGLSGSTLTLTLQTESNGGNELFAFRNISIFGIAAAASDIDGDASNNVLTGTAAGEIVNGDDGNDILKGNGGGDTLNGGTGIDTASYSQAPTGVRIDLTDTANNTGDAAGDVYNSIERYFGSFSDDIFIGDSGNDIFRGRDGND